MAAIKAEPMSSPIKVSIANESLWRKFSNEVTEMVVTKSGRKMFPKLEYKIEGLHPHHNYALFLRLKRIDDFRHKYMSGAWMQCGKAEPDPAKSSKMIAHQDGVNTGETWMRQSVSFDRIKITNNAADSAPSNICLTSMCKYVPELFIYRQNSIISTPDGEGQSFILPLTEFIAVTAYQNQVITHLKIEHNPFAKGFREGPSSSRERKRSSGSSSPSSEPSATSPKRTPPVPPSTHSLPPTPTTPAPVFPLLPHYSLLTSPPFIPTSLSFPSPILQSRPSSSAEVKGDVVVPPSLPLPFPFYPSLSSLPYFNGASGLNSLLVSHLYANLLSSSLGVPSSSPSSSSSNASP